MLGTILNKKNIIAGCFLFVLTIVLTSMSCADKKTALFEDTGKKMDQGIQKTGDSIDQGLNKAGEKVKDATH